MKRIDTQIIQLGFILDLGLPIIIHIGATIHGIMIPGIGDIITMIGIIHIMVHVIIHMDGMDIHITGIIITTIMDTIPDPTTHIGIIKIPGIEPIDLEPCILEQITLHIEAVP